MKWLSNEAVERLRAAAAMPDLSGTRYRLLEKLGRGGMGVVWLAEDTQLGRRVALKVLDLPSESADLETRLLREARILAQLEHPGIVPVHDAGTLADGRVFYAMKYVQGRRLDHHLADLPSLRERLRVFQRICEAVAFAHSRGVLHRDLKLQNIMVGAFGEVLVMDWGVAKIRSAAGEEEIGTFSDSRRDSFGSTSQTKHGTVLGTPGYMAPEQARGELNQVDERADIYSLGAILSTTISGRLPLTTPPLETRNGGQSPVLPAGLGRRAPGIPRPLEAICRKATATLPQERYASVENLAADVAAYLEGQPVTAYPESILARLERLYSKHRTAVLLILTYLLVRAFLIVFGRR